MEFKGGATVSDLNASLSDAENGDTYKATTKGKLSDGQAVEIGDMVIAHVEGSTREWVVVQANLDGAVTSTDTLTAGRLVIGAGNQGVALAAAGTSGQVLKSTGSGIEWADEVKTREIKAGGKTVVDAGTSDAVNITAGDNVEVRISGHDIVIGAVDTTYEAGKGITIEDEVVSLKQATSSELGGIKIGHTSSGNEYGVQLDSNGSAYVTVDATISAGTGITVEGRTVGLGKYGKAGTYGSASVTTEATSVVIPKITTDEYGRVTVADQTVTIKDTTYNTATAEAAGLIKATVATETIAPTVNDSTNRSV
jgi:hypothetical protein